MASHNVLILIHRPFLVLLGLQMDGVGEAHETSSLLAERSSAICSSSATEIVRLCGLLSEHYTLQCAVFMVAYFLANACTVRLYMMDSASGASGDRVQDESFDQGVELLREMAKTWPVARRALHSVRRLAADLEKSRRRTASPDKSSTQVRDGDHYIDDLPRSDHSNPLLPQDWASLWLPMGQSDEWLFIGGF